MVCCTGRNVSVGWAFVSFDRFVGIVLGVVSITRVLAHLVVVMLRWRALSAVSISLYQIYLERVLLVMLSAWA